MRECCDRWRRCSPISAGPVAQLMPMTSGSHGVERGERGADLGAGQHAAGELDGDLHLDRHLAADRRHGPAAADHRGLAAEQVELRLDEEQVDAAVEQAAACTS